MFNHLEPAILPLAIFFFICSTIGCIGNAIMIICTISSKRLRSPCHFLISMTCLIDAFHIWGQFPFCYQLIVGSTATQSECFFILIFPIVGYTAGGPLILAMGFDRLIAVKFPTSYRYYQSTPTRYILIQMVFPMIYTIGFLVFGFIERDTDPLKQITCANPLALNGASFELYTYTSAFIYIAIFFVYFFVYLLLKSNKTSSRFKKVFRSILVTVCFVLFGWVATMIANTCSYLVTDSLETAHLIQTYAGIAVNFAAASNVFVFYAINSEYRDAINSLFGREKVDGSVHTDTSTAQEDLQNRSHHKSRSTRSLSVFSISMSSRRMTLV